MESYTSRPAVPTESNERPTVSTARGRSGRHFEPVKKPWKWIIAAAAALLLIGVGVWLLLSGSSFGSGVDSSRYQAVFLTNGQVYFGKMQAVGSDYIKMTDVFYVQSSSSATTTESKDQSTSESSDSNIQLIKLGNEVHGPEDTMMINRDQVLFFENLKKDGKVTQSIENYKKDNQ